jgi:N-acetylglucosamine-6-phosphate deacetylase
MITLINAKIPGIEDLQQIEINSDGKIDRLESMQETMRGEKIIDLEGDILSLGGVDLQINGGLGLAFPDLEITDIEKLDKISDYLWQQGIDGYLPTLVTTAVDKFQKSLEVIAQYIEKQQRENKPTARVLGVHLEGPFLNYEKRGAHPAQYLLIPSLETVDKLFGNYLSIVKIITLAPELDSSGAVIKYLSDRGITVSLGHSQANQEIAKKAFQQGAKMVTHAFNAMPPLHHRQPGLLGEAIVNPDVYCGLIADGQHVHPTMIELLLKASDYHRGIFLVSDALAPIGLGDGVYPWDEREIEVKKGTARLFEGTLAGTTLPLLQGVINLVNWGICDLETAILLATAAPRKAIGLTSLSVGQTANFLRWQSASNWERLDFRQHFCL